ncbi:MAG: MEDS domain-containing protein [Deltaproteobacteria bacterium]|nr:MEDS domain-containing protein [Deltaproteobacteria bacterium]
MCSSHTMVNLGFAEAELPAGTHICQIYSDDRERDESLLRFLFAGLHDGERGACFSNDFSADVIEAYCDREGLDIMRLRERQALSVSDVSSVYFKDGVFNPDVMLGLLEAYHDKAKSDGFRAARVVGEMTAEVNDIQGGKRLLEYESRVSLLLRKKPVTAMCQYNAHAFDGAMIMEVLRVHPMMIVSGAVVRNPFFIQPEEYLKRCEYVV